MSVLVAIGVNAEGYREIIGAAEGEKEDKEVWLAVLRHLKERGLSGVRLIDSDKCLCLVESVAEAYLGDDWQRCVVHWYRNIFKNVPREKMRTVAAMLKEMKLHKASLHIEESVEETLAYIGLSGRALAADTDE